MIVAGAIARLALASAIGLGVDESYAAAVARPLSLSYFDHPPLTFWMVAAMQRLSDHHDVLIRIPFIALFTATTWMSYRLTARAFGERAGLYAAILLTIIPVFGVSAGGWALPDGPLMFGVVAAALCLSHAVETPRRADARLWWIGVGVSAGVAALSKYHVVFLAAGILVFLATSRDLRRWLTRAEPYAAAAIALALSVPVFAWNARHAWSSFRFQLARAGAHRGPAMISLLQNLAGQSAYLLPWVWVPLVVLCAAGWRRGPRDRMRWMFVCLGTGPVIAFTLVSLRGSPGLPHWPASGFLLLVPLLADRLSWSREQTGDSRVAWYLGGSAAFVVCAVAVAALQIDTGWLSRRFPSAFARGDPSLDAVDWIEVRAPLERRTPAEQTPIVIGADWIDSAKLGAALGADATVLCFSDDPRHFQFDADQRELLGRDALVVLRADPVTAAEWTRRRIAPSFRSMDSTGVIAIHRRGKEVIRLVVYRASTLLRPYDEPSAGVTR